MLDWLTTQKTDHPMHSIEEAERLLTGVSDEPLQALDEVASWLTTLAQAAGFNLQPVSRLPGCLTKPVSRSSPNSAAHISRNAR